VLVGSAPQMAAFDPATHTVYVANAGDNTLSVVNAGTCNAHHTAGCGQTPTTVAAGSGANGVAIDDATHTVYVTDGGSGTVSVINAATCNAADTSGCGQKPATVTVGAGPTGLAVDPATDTIYVANNGLGVNSRTVSVINGTTCNAADTSGCGQKPATVLVGRAPFYAAFDAINKTVYVTDIGGNSVSMINARTCNATVTAGCGRKPATVAVGRSPIPVTVDPRTNTVYVGNNGDATVSLIDGATCNATRTSGCGHPVGILRIPGGPLGLAVNEATRTLFVSNNSTATGSVGPGHSPVRANSVSVINAAICNARTTSGCGQRAPTALTGAAGGPGPVVEATDTLYVPTGDDAVTIVNGATCNAKVRTGCGQPVPATMTGADPFSIAANPGANTLYVGNFGSSTISLINGATCNTVVSSGCQPHPTAIVMTGGPYGLAVNQATHTLYATTIFTASGQPGRTVSVINTATCNATVMSGCRKTPPTVTVGSAPAGVAVDQATDTVYVANHNEKTVSVINGATCNATDSSGCGQTPAQVHLGSFPLAVAVNQATDTIYALNPGAPSTVSVINGATCNGKVTSGCGRIPPKVTVGNFSNLEGLAVNQATNTVYVVNTGDDTVSVIDGATCNGTVTAGCGQTPAHVNVGRQGFGFAAVDSTSDLIYVSNYLDDTVSVIDGSTCNGKVSFGCGRTPPTVPAGANPAGLTVNRATDTIYVDDNGAATASYFQFKVPGRPSGVTASLFRGQAGLVWQPPRHGRLPIIYRILPTPPCPTCRGLITPPTSGAPFTTITGLIPGQRYTFRVKATDAAGTGRPSAPSSPVTP
jgi:YVTN family beta-propeller protein